MQHCISSKVYGIVSPEQQKQMSGLEFVQGLANGTLPLNTMAQTLGYDVSEAVKGRVVVTATPDDTHLNPAGTVHGGIAATMLDTCMGLAIHSTLEKGLGSTTLEFKVSLVRPITPCRAQRFSILMRSCLGRSGSTCWDIQVNGRPFHARYDLAHLGTFCARATAPR
jgi:uncharacterized protein (TIGR00369 family)